MKSAILIPARLESRRLPGKLLLRATGKPLIQHTYEAAMRCKAVSGVYVATGDRAIADAVRGFGGQVIETAADHPNGSSRVADAAKQLHSDVHLIVNVQGDEPALDPAAVDRLIGLMTCYDMGTLSGPLHPEDHANRHTVKVAVSAAGKALYFSRAALAGAQRHIGVYAYWRMQLHYLHGLPPTAIADAEKLEQLTFLEMGWTIGVVPTDRMPAMSIDTKDDYDRFVAWHRNQQARSDR